jgi:pimeloyl-ACP methyl ester carboxylesterase
MSKLTVVWVNANPSFKYFDQRIVNHLSKQVSLAYWEYHQHQDEPSSLDIAVDLLHDYLTSLSQPINLVGHATGGLLSLLYARRYPQKVNSLILLGVGANPASDWQAHYYQMRKLLPCSQEIVLSRMVQMMFGLQDRINMLKLMQILRKDLLNAPTSHSLYHQSSISAGQASVPLMVCGSSNDGIVDYSAFQGWSEYLKKEDQMWLSPAGHHFFHYFFSEQTAQQILEFWQKMAIDLGSISFKVAR